MLKKRRSVDCIVTRVCDKSDKDEYTYKVNVTCVINVNVMFSI